MLETAHPSRRGRAPARYVQNAVHLAPGSVRPSGYSVMLWLLGPFHSLIVVVGVQHLLGLGIAALDYALLRRAGLPGWGPPWRWLPCCCLPTRSSSSIS